MNLRSGIWLGVALAHGAAIGLAALSVDHTPSNFGGAPVIELTLSPSVMFNGPQGSQTSEAETTPTPTPSKTSSTKAEQAPADQDAKSQPDLPQPRQTQTPVAAATTPAPIKPSNAPQATGTNTSSGKPATNDSGRPQTAQPSQAGLSQGHGAATLGASGQTQIDAYEATVIQWIERHKSHPGGPNGVVTLGFTLDRRGNLRASRILASSGNAALDRTALDQLKAASPFPRPPHGTTWQTRDFRVRMDYQAAPRR